MKAAILEKLNSSLVVDDLELPDLQYGQVLVRVLCSTICGAQINEISGAKGEDKYLPHLLGHEGCGEVVGVGVGVSTVTIGDRVVMHWRRGSGIEASPPKYRRNGTLVGGGWVTTFNEMAVVSENRLTRIPKDTPIGLASLMGCAITTGLGLISNEAQLKIGQSIAVAGVGGVGLNVVQGASMVTANPIIAIDIYREKLRMAASLGATHAIDASKSPIVDTVREIVGRRGLDVFVDCTGNPKVIDSGLIATRAGGRMILVGQPPIGIPLILSDVRQHYCGKTILDSQGGGTYPTEDIPRYLALFDRHELSINTLITNKFPLDSINEALDLVRGGKSGRVMLEM